MKVPHQRRVLCVRILITLATITLFGGSQKALAQQWTTNGNDISNTNSGNVGVGTTTPWNKLTVLVPTGVRSGITVAGEGNTWVYTDLNLTPVSGGIATGKPTNFAWSVRKDAFYGGDSSGPSMVMEIARQGGGSFVPFIINPNGNVILSGATNATNGNVGIGTNTPAVKLAINGSGVNVYNTDAWLENNMHVQGNETLSQGGRGRLRVGSAWGYSGLFADASSTGAVNDLILGASSLNVRIGPGASSVQNFLVPNGNVGIGTITPGTRLAVQGPVPSGTTDIFRVHPGATVNNGSIFTVSSLDTAGGSRAGTRMTIYGDNAGNAGSLVLDWFNPASGNRAVLAGPNGILFYTNAAVTGGSPRAFTFRSVDLSPFGGPNAVVAVQNAAGGDLFLVQQGGNVGIGTSAPAKTLDVAGDINASGTITGGNIIAKYQDVAEWVPAVRALPPGTVVTLNPTQSNHVEASSKAYDTLVAGVISAQPGITLGEQSESKVLVAATGRVKVKVDATYAPIHIGDLLVTSDTPGMAMKSEPITMRGRQIHAPGTLIGKALEPLEKGRGEILVLLSLQ